MRESTFLGEEYGESKYSTESHWFARGFCHGSDADGDLETSRDRKLTERCGIYRRGCRSNQARRLEPPARFDSFFVPLWLSRVAYAAKRGKLLRPTMAR
jgi:hypothetical protein